MYNYELITLLEKVLNKSYQMKNGEHAFYCPFCNHHKKKLQILLNHLSIHHNKILTAVDPIYVCSCIDYHIS